MKRILYFIISIVFVVGLTGCSSKPPKYNGESAKEWGKKVSIYFGKKLDKISNEDIKKFLNENNKVFNDYKNKLKTIKNNDEMVELVDNTIEKIIDLYDKYLDISEDDFDYLTNPLKYYHIEDDYPPLVQDMINGIMIPLWFQFKSLIQYTYYKQMFCPFDVVYDLRHDYRIDKEKYNYIASHSKYKKYFSIPK
jgi:hypothetical protein